ncbi:SIR2 family protein [Chryseobacterium profundimaris]|uniref:SIR2-like domain-containing protein n=1 Tax=Chryseobacterium profundimaris TaxID=1387275 RepID=A0ABY1P283_9FLAO|nr:SIR2 family protein [Chryseobacterium profundimaris]SMP23442.1 SIR2-like domain-containing protein [Chryseobacterium profundimaris]
MFTEELKNHLSKFNTSPFLFIGSGFSRRYLNIPTWEELLIEMVDRLKLSKPYEFYKSNSNADLTKIASLMGEEFNAIWWENDDFKISRENFQKIATSKFSPLKYEISKRVHDNSENIDDENIEKEIKLLKKANIDGIITTNWDTLCEKLFPTFTSFIGQEELIFSELFTVGEIYKIHGSIENPNSLILTAQDYQEFQERNTYLAAKLLTLFIENPIIFIGYSLDDKNVQGILKSIIRCLTKDKIQKLQDRLIFCQWVAEEIEAEMTDSTMLISETVIPIKLIRLNSFMDLYTVLANNKKKLPTKVLRQMKGMIYDFVKSNNSKQKIFVADNLDDIENIHNAEFVYGIGIKDKLSDIGIKGIDLKDILSDILIDKNWNSVSISRLCLPAMQLNARFIPYFKHLRLGNFLNDDGTLNDDNDITEFSPDFISTVNNVKREDFYPNQSYLKKKEELNTKCNSVTDVMKAYDNDLHHLVYISLLDDDKISLDELEKVLIDKKNLLHDSKIGTYYRKLICLYDFLKHRTIR